MPREIDPKKVYSAQEAADELIADGSDDGRLLSEDSEEEFSDEERNRDTRRKEIGGNVEKASWRTARDQVMFSSTVLYLSGIQVFVI